MTNGKFTSFYGNGRFTRSIISCIHVGPTCPECPRKYSNMASKRNCFHTRRSSRHTRTMLVQDGMGLLNRDCKQKDRTSLGARSNSELGNCHVNITDRKLVLYKLTCNLNDRSDLCLNV